MPSENIVLCVKLGGDVDIEIRMDPRVPADVAQRICDAVGLLQQRIVSEEDAAQAIEFLEQVTTDSELSRSCCAIAHLCLAETYIQGAAPQYGLDRNRAFRAILDFLQSVSTEADYEQHFPQVRHVTHALSRIATELPGLDLTVYANELIEIAENVPGMQGVALRACLYRPHLAKAESGALVARNQTDPTRLREEALLDSLLCQLATVDLDRTALYSEAQRLQEERSFLSVALDAERKQKRLLEEMVLESTATTEQLKLINSDLSHRVDQNQALAVALQLELGQHKQRAREGIRETEEVAVNLAQECRRLQAEVEGRDQMCVELHTQLVIEREAQGCDIDHLYRQLEQKGDLCRKLEAQLQDERDAQLLHLEHPQEPNVPQGKDRRKGRNGDVHPLHFDLDEELSNLLQRQPIDKSCDEYNREILEQAAKQAASIFHEAGHRPGRSSIARATVSTSTTRSTTPTPSFCETPCFGS